MDDIKTAAQRISNGEVVAFPTETVYGLGVDATNEIAVSNIYKLKNRPLINPLIVHIASLKKAMDIAVFNKEALQLAQAFWPGPLTIILPLNQAHEIASSVLAGLKTVALRVPSHPIALSLLEEVERPIAAPSANISGYISSTTCEHVEKDFSKNSIFILKAPVDMNFTGLESTIIDLSNREALDSQTITILRSGSITADALQTILPYKYISAKSENANNAKFIVKSPGMLLQHYAPTTKLRKDALELADNEIGLNFGLPELANPYNKYNLNLSYKGDLQEAAKNLYGMLRKLDEYAKEHRDIKNIVVAPIPYTGIGVAINDRLTRASVGSNSKIYKSIS